MMTLGRIEELYSGLTPAESDKLDRIKTDIRVALTRVYGSDLSDLMTEAVLHEAICHPDIIAAVSGVVDALPETRKQWDSIAVDLVKGNDLAQRNVAVSREARMHLLRSEELENLGPQQRINLARSGRLDEFLDERVSARLEVES